MLPSKALETLLFWDAGTSSRRRASAASSFASSSALLSFVQPSFDVVLFFMLCNVLLVIHSALRHFGRARHSHCDATLDVRVPSTGRDDEAQRRWCLVRVRSHAMLRARVSFNEVRARSTHARATSCARTRTRKKARRLLSEKKKSTLSGNRTQGIRLEGEYVATTPIVSNPRPHLARTTTRKSIREGSRRAGDLFASPSLALLDLKSALLRSLDARNDARFRPRAAQSTVTTQPASAARQNAQAIPVADAFKRCRLARSGSCRVRVAVLREQQEQGRRRPDGLQPGHHRQQQEEEVGAPRAAAFDARRQDAGAAAASLELRCRTSKIPSATLSTCEREISLRVEAFGSMNATRRRRRTRRGDEYPVIAPGSLTHRRACAPFLWHHRCQTRRQRGPSADDLDPGAAN